MIKVIYSLVPLLYSLMFTNIFMSAYPNELLVGLFSCIAFQFGVVSLMNTSLLFITRRSSSSRNNIR